MQKIAETLKLTKLRNKIIEIIGGVAVKKEDDDELGAFFGRNKEVVVEIAKKAIR